MVTTVAGEERSGCLVGFHSQSSIEPERYAVWLSKANHTTGVALGARYFAVHLLDRSQHDLAALFGGTTGDDVDKLARCEWDPGPDGVPLLRDCPHRVVGHRVSLVSDVGDHLGVILEPVAVEHAGRLHPMRLSDADDIDPGHPAGDPR